MPQRIDRVIRKGYEDDQFVYSLVLDEYGLYIIHTGNVGGLATSGDVHVNSDDEGSATFSRQIIEQEARLEKDALPVLVHSQHSAYIPRQQVTSATADTSAVQPSLTVETVTDSYTFEFSGGSAADVTALADALREHDARDT